MAGDKDLPEPDIEYAPCVADPDRPQVKTQFIDYPLKELKAMLNLIDPDTIEVVGRHWASVEEILSGGEGGGVAGTLDKAVKNVLEHWEGDAARSFEKKAQEISQSIRYAAWHADINSSQMADAAFQLRKFSDELNDIHEPSNWAKLGDALSDWDWDEGEAVAGDLKDRKLTADEVAKINEGKIGASREAHLQGVAVMENLAAQYIRVTGNLKRNRVIEEKGHIKEPNRDVEYPPPVTGGTGGASRPGASGAAPKPWSAGPTTGVKPAPRVSGTPGITGGTTLPPTAKTNVDSINPGLTGRGPVTNPNIGGGGGSGPGTGGTQGPGVFATGGGPGLGRGGTAGRGGIGTGGRGGLTGGGTAGRGAGGRAGIGGMGGGAGAGGAGRGGAAAGGRGALAKARGGVVGAAKGVTGKGAGGGAGLHGSRGGTQRGAMAGGMGGAMGGRNGRRPGDENSRGERPDYLVEDEETWISEEDRNRNVPRTIE
ncbi:hypothetical protein [Streptomyces sp. NPDC127084]|uniref:hypothetical protein n=1 Tax=Streptomyces sp. NPDC127084 TaxID=3347133 RepID=UPI00365694DE